METLSIIPEVVNSNNMTMTVKIGQGEHEHETKFDFVRNLTIGDVANIILNEVYSMVTIQRLTRVKGKASLNEPFTFQVSVENEESYLDIPAFNSKITFADKGVEKLLANMPQIIAELVISKNMPFAERRQAIKQPNAIQLVLQ